MSVFAFQRAVRDSDELDTTAKLVGLVLSTYMDGQGYCFPSQTRIGANIGRSRETVRRAVRSLELAGFLVTRRTKREPNRYRGVIPRRQRPHS